MAFIPGKFELNYPHSHSGDGMSAFGPKQTGAPAPHMSTFGGKADMAFCKDAILARSWNNYHPTLFADGLERRGGQGVVS